MFVWGITYLTKHKVNVLGFCRYSLSALLDYNIFYWFKSYVDRICVLAVVVSCTTTEPWIKSYLTFLSEKQRKSGIRMWKNRIAVFCFCFLSAEASHCIQVWMVLGVCFAATSSKKNNYLKDIVFFASVSYAQAALNHREVKWPIQNIKTIY